MIPGFRLTFRDLLWPSNPWVREVLCSIQETGDKKVPRDTKQEIKDYKEGWGSSLVCEEEIRALGQASKAHNAAFLSSMTQWHNLLTNGVLNDNFTTPIPRITPECDFTMAKKLDASVFDHSFVHDEDEKFSPGFKLLEEIASKEHLQIMVS